MKSKSDVQHLLPAFLAMIETQFEARVKRIQTDNGGEFQSQSLLGLYAKKALFCKPAVLTHHNKMVWLNANTAIFSKQRELSDSRLAYHFVFGVNASSQQCTSSTICHHEHLGSKHLMKCSWVDSHTTTTYAFLGAWPTCTIPGPMTSLTREGSNVCFSATHKARKDICCTICRPGDYQFQEMSPSLKLSFP